MIVLKQSGAVPFRSPHYQELAIYMVLRDTVCSVYVTGGELLRSAWQRLLRLPTTKRSVRRF